MPEPVPVCVPGCFYYLNPPAAIRKNEEPFAKLATAICEVPSKERSELQTSRREQSAIASFAKGSEDCNSLDEIEAKDVTSAGGLRK